MHKNTSYWLIENEQIQWKVCSRGIHFSHPLSFSTPDLILKNFVIWLCEPVDDPNGNDEEKIPRVILYTEGGQKQDLAKSANTPESEKGQLQDPLFRSSDTSLELSTSKQDARYCIECGIETKI